MDRSETDDRLTLIELDQPRPGYRKFITCWLYQDEAQTFVVDPGPTSTIPMLLEALAAQGVSHLDLVLLTHIHLDHGGGTAAVLRAFPEARIFCHEDARRHLEDPRRLWQGSVATVGDVAEMYGEPAPVAADRFVSAGELARRDIQILPTPGHASHHVSFLTGGILFAGEAIVTRQPLADGREYLRPATPPRFFADVFFASLDRLHDLEPEPEKTAFAHYGLARGVRTWCGWAREQLALWIYTVREAMTQGEPELDALVETLLDRDPHFGQGLFAALPEDLRERERYYARNSLRGLIQAAGSTS